MHLTKPLHTPPARRQYGCTHEASSPVTELATARLVRHTSPPQPPCSCPHCHITDRNLSVYHDNYSLVCCSHHMALRCSAGSAMPQAWSYVCTRYSRAPRGAEHQAPRCLTNHPGGPMGCPPPAQSPRRYPYPCWGHRLASVRSCGRRYSWVGKART